MQTDYDVNTLLIEKGFFFVMSRQANSITIYGKDKEMLPVFS